MKRLWSLSLMKGKNLLSVMSRSEGGPLCFLTEVLGCRVFQTLFLCINNIIFCVTLNAFPERLAQELKYWCFFHENYFQGLMIFVNKISTLTHSLFCPNSYTWLLKYCAVYDQLCSCSLVSYQKFAMEKNVHIMSTQAIKKIADWQINIYSIYTV